ncbi:SRSF4 factor, partial [Polyodon spathula]|nr:SRSF4 factor [Polyodon spathula]
MSGCRVFIGRLSPHARERDVEKFFKGFGHIREINLKNGFGFVEFDDHRDADDAVYELNGKELCSERVTIEHARSPRGRGGGGAGGGGGGRFSPRFSSYRQSRGSMYGPPVRTEHRIIVENLSSRISWQQYAGTPSPSQAMKGYLVLLVGVVSWIYYPDLIRFAQIFVKQLNPLVSLYSLSSSPYLKDLKDMMRKVGEVTFVDAHRSNKNEGVVEFASHSDMKNAIDKLDGTELNGRKLKLTEERKRE